jgi:hypothetical protein
MATPDTFACPEWDENLDTVPCSRCGARVEIKIHDTRVGFAARISCPCGVTGGAMAETREDARDALRRKASNFVQDRAETCHQAVKLGQETPNMFKGEK